MTDHGLQRRDEDFVASAASSSELQPPATIQHLLANEREKMLKQIGAGLKLTDEQKATLATQASAATLAVKPTGELYVPGNFWRVILNHAFDPMGWGVRPGAPHLDLHNKADAEDKGQSVLYREVFLVVSRCGKCFHSLSACKCKPGPKAPQPIAVATAIGAQQYHPNNVRMTYDDAAEAATTNGLMRCGKVFGLYSNIWEPVWATQMRAELCFEVFIRNGYPRKQWRRTDMPHLRDEEGLTPSSPNRDKYVVATRENDQQQSRTLTSTRPMTSSAEQIRPAPSDATSVSTVGEKILVIRGVMDSETKSQGWVVNTDAREYFTDDSELVKSLENAKQRGHRITPKGRTQTNERGTRNVITSFTVPA